MLFQTLSVFLFFNKVANSNSELFSSLDQMRALAAFDVKHIDLAHEYIRAEKERLRQIGDFLLTTNNTSLEHPVDQHKLVERMARKWPAVVAKYVRPPASVFAQLGRYTSALTDIKGAYAALIRLQSAYDLKASDFATTGSVYGELPVERLKNEDIFYMGSTAYEDANYERCYEWMVELVKRNAATGDNNGIDKVKMFDFVAICAAKLGRVDEAISYTEKLLELEPDHKRAKSNLYFFKHEPHKNKVASVARGYTKSQEFITYERICRENPQPPVTRRLKCYLYTNNNHPALVIAPLKLEQLAVVPELVRLYDFVTDAEIELIKELSTPQLKRATVHNIKTGELEHAIYRVSKSAWLNRDEYQVVRRVSDRITAATNLTLDTSESLQIANYGIGGQYEPHHDYSRRNVFPRGQGNRIATLLVYLSEVRKGGATAFLYPEVAVAPVKGSAVFWYNLLPSGERDVVTLHAACPVILGGKWVANQWIRERGQEFIRRCGLDEGEEGSIL